MNQEFSFDRFYGLRKFQGDHPAIMKNLIVAQDWTFDYKLKLSEWTFKDINCLMSDMFEKVFQHRIGEYKNYRLL